MANSNGIDFLIDKQPFKVEADWDDLTEKAQERITAEFMEDRNSFDDNWDKAQAILIRKYFPLYSLPLEK